MVQSFGTMALKGAILCKDAKGRPVKACVLSNSTRGSHPIQLHGSNVICNEKSHA